MNAILLSILLGQTGPVPCDAQASAALALAKAKRERVSVPVQAAYQSPPGFHRHMFRDGTVIEHSDASKDDRAAHTHNGEVQWNKYNGPLPPTVKSESRKIVRWKKVCHGDWCEMVPVYSN